MTREMSSFYTQQRHSSNIQTTRHIIRNSRTHQKSHNLEDAATFNDRILRAKKTT